MKFVHAAIAAALLGACTTTGGSDQTAGGGPHSDCFHAGEVTGYGVVDEHRVRLSVGTRHYIFTIPQNTRDLDWNHAISVRSISSFICTGSGAGVQLMGGEPPIPYQVTSIERAPNDTQPSGS